MPRQRVASSRKNETPRRGAGSDAAWELAPLKVRRLRAAGKPAAALAALQDEVAEDPRRAWAYALGAELKRAAPFEKHSEAFEDFEKAAALAPGEAWILGYWARALAAAGRAEDASGKIDRAVALAPELAWLRGERALIRLAAGRVTEALEDAAACLRGEPDYFPAHWAAAQARARAGEWGKALEFAVRARTLRPRALERVESLRFDCLRALGRFDEAAGVLAAAVARGQRLSWTEGDDFATAGGELDAALRAKPRAAWLHFWKGELRQREGRLAEAEAAFTRALELDARHLWARAWRAENRRLAGDDAGALADAEAGLKPGRHPARAILDWQLRALRGELRLKAGKSAAAAADFTKAIAEAPSQARTFVKRAVAEIGLGKISGAESDLRSALELDPELRPAYLLRAALREERGNAEGALSDRKRGELPGGSGMGGGLRWVRARARLAPPPRQRGRGRVCVDPRIELVGILKLALDRKPVPDFALKRAPEMAAFVAAAEKRLFPFVTPELTERFRATAKARGNAGFPWLGITQMLMDVSPAPEMKPLTAAWRDGDDLCLLGRMRKFVEKSRFLEFLDAHEALFARWTRPLRATVEKEDYAKTVSSYLGVEVDAYYDLVLSPLLRDVGLRAILRGADDARGARTVLCPLTSAANLEAALAPKDEDLLWTGWHEMLHLRLDPWCDFYEPEAEEFRRLYAVVPPEVRRKNWLDCFSEHHVRAATQRLLRLRRGPVAQEALAKIDRAEGYSYQDALAERLAEYEGARDKYPALLDFFPEWFKVWRAIP